MRTSVHRNPDALEVGPISAAVGVAPAQQSYLQLRIQYAIDDFASSTPRSATSASPTSALNIVPTSQCPSVSSSGSPSGAPTNGSSCSPFASPRRSRPADPVCHRRVRQLSANVGSLRESYQCTQHCSNVAVLQLLFIWVSVGSADKWAVVLFFIRVTFICRRESLSLLSFQIFLPIYLKIFNCSFLNLINDLLKALYLLFFSQMIYANQSR